MLGAASRTDALPGAGSRGDAILSCRGGAMVVCADAGAVLVGERKMKSRGMAEESAGNPPPPLAVARAPPSPVLSFFFCASHQFRLSSDARSGIVESLPIDMMFLRCRYLFFIFSPSFFFLVGTVSPS